MSTKKENATIREPLSTTRDAIFERACKVEIQHDPRLSDTDRLLSAMVIFDSVCVHDGVISALACHSPQELKHAIAGFRHFGLHHVADVVASIAERAPTSEDWIEFEDAYMEACPDTAVEAAYASFFERHPDDFARPSLDDMAKHRSTNEFVRTIGRKHPGPEPKSRVDPSPR